MISTSSRPPDRLHELPEEERPTDADPAPPAGECSDCGGTVSPLWTPPDPRLAYRPRGQWETPRRCPSCLEAERTQERLERLRSVQDDSGIPARYQPFSFGRHVKERPGEAWAAFRDRLEATEARNEGAAHLGITAWNARAARALRDWRPEERRPRPLWFLLAGPVGSGKTTLAAAAVNDLIERLDAVRLDRPTPWRISWLPVADLWEILRLEQSRKRDRGLLASLARTDLLILDDLGTTERLHDWQRDAMELLVSQRYNHQRATILTSNHRIDSADPEEPTIAGHYGDRVASRLIECLGGRRHGPPPGYLELAGMDWRADTAHQLPNRPRNADETTTTPSPDRKAAAAGERE